MTTSILVTNTSTEISEVILIQIFYIQYPVKFCKDRKTIQTLINFGSEAIAMIPAYAAVLGLKVCFIAIGA